VTATRSGKPLRRALQEIAARHPGRCGRTGHTTAGCARLVCDFSLVARHSGRHLSFRPGIHNHTGAWIRSAARARNDIQCLIPPKIWAALVRTCIPRGRRGARRRQWIRSTDRFDVTFTTPSAQINVSSTRTQVTAEIAALMQRPYFRASEGGTCQALPAFFSFRRLATSFRSAASPPRTPLTKLILHRPDYIRLRADIQTASHDTDVEAFELRNRFACFMTSR